jgi:hypothetical protein
MPSATRARPRRLPLALLTAGLVLALGGCAGQGGTTAGSGAQPPATPALDPPAGSFDAPATPPTAPGFEVGDLPERLAVPGPAAPPVRVVIPAIGVATDLTRLGLEPDGTMAVPDDFHQAGWFAQGPAPGQPGPAVIAGHVDSRTGPAVFYRLRELRAGHVIHITRADGTRLRFVVESARSYPKTSFPTAAVFGPVPSAALRLITCGGDFDRTSRSYHDNLVVFAHLA